MLTVSLLVCAVMALTRAAAVPEAEPGTGTGPLIQKVKSHMVKRSLSCLWDRIGAGRCFFYIPIPMTWADAEKNCQDYGGNLASVHGYEELAWVKNVTASDKNKYPVAWIGGCDAQQEGSWFWSDGSPFMFDYWAKGQPDNNRGYGHCMTMNYADQKKFDDVPCSFRNPSVCALKPGYLFV